ISISEVERLSDGAVGVVPSTSQWVATYDPASFTTQGIFRFAILSGNTLAGEVLIKVDRAYVEQQFVDVFLDVLVVILVVLLLAFEIMLVAVSRSLSKPLDGLFQILERQAVGDFSHR